jgi:acetoin utilization deacetylase AcuC-like enzyme
VKIIPIASDNVFAPIWLMAPRSIGFFQIIKFVFIMVKVMLFLSRFMSRIKISYHPIFKYPLPEGHRFPMEKYDLLKTQLIYEGLYDEVDFTTPSAMEEDLLRLTHTADYLHKLEYQLLDAKEIRAIGFPMTPLLVERGRHIAQGTYEMALHALDTGAGLNIAGGTHHSFDDRGEGFCIFNDIALAANALIHRHQIRKVLIVDLDVHQGNGTAKIFGNNDLVYTFSMHGEKNYPLRKEKSDLDIGLPDRISDNEYHQILKGTLPKLIDSVKPQIIFYQSGVDVLESDKLGRLSLSLNGCKIRDEIVYNLAKNHEIPIVASMGGGYSQKLSDIVNAHTNTYRVARDHFG